MSSRSLLFATVLALSCRFHSSQPHDKPAFPWMENLVRLPFPELNRTDIQSASLDEIPNALKPFINETAFKEEQRRRNSTEDEVITDEDVADMPDDDEHPRVNSAHFDGKTTTVTISSEAGTELYQHWLDQAVSGLMAAVATKKLENVSDIQKAAHQTCAKGAKTVQAHAKCVVMLLDIELKYQRWNAKFGNAKRIGFASAKLSNVVKTKGKKVLSRYRKVRRRKTSQKLQPAGAFKQTQSRRRQRLPFKEVQKETKYQITETPPPPQQKEYIPSDDGWIGSFRMRAKRSIAATATKPKQMATYSLLEEKPISPLALLAKKLVQTMRTLKHKDKKYKSWQKVVAEIKEEGKKIKQKQKAKKLLDKRFELFKRTLRDEGVDKSIMKKMDVLGEDDDDDDDDDDENETEKLMREAKVQEYRLTDEERLMQAPVKLIREGLKLGMAMSGHNVTDFDGKNLKLISPRLLSLVPDDLDQETINLLSPSLLALHDQGQGMEDDLSLGKALKYFDDQGHQEWLNFVIEASGVTDAITKMKDANLQEEGQRMEEQFRGDNGQPLYFTKENVTEMFGNTERNKIDVFEELQKSLTPQQVEEQNKRGYSIMTDEQKRLIYGRHSPYNDTNTLERFRGIDDRNVHTMIDKEIRMIAEAKDWKIRKRDIVLTPVIKSPILIAATPLLSQPVILSPLVFSPSILTPAVLGPVILGPWVFIPVILSPRLLSPLIINPLIFSPIILSPLVLHPLILSPGIFNPLILSPLLLSPFILSPQVFTPLILTPFVLNPIILTPAVGSPLILSPFVLSPIILSNQVLFGVILSPYVLSPLVFTKLTLTTVVASPSWLS